MHHTVTPPPEDAQRRAEWSLTLKLCFSHRLTKHQLLFQEASKAQQIWINKSCMWRMLEDCKPSLNPTILGLQESEAELSVIHESDHTWQLQTSCIANVACRRDQFPLRTWKQLTYSQLYTPCSALLSLTPLLPLNSVPTLGLAVLLNGRWGLWILYQTLCHRRLLELSGAWIIIVPPNFTDSWAETPPPAPGNRLLTLELREAFSQQHEWCDACWPHTNSSQRESCVFGWVPDACLHQPFTSFTQNLWSQSCSMRAWNH